MKIFLQAKHQYPAKNGGPGGGRVFDCLAKGLAEFGHEVRYSLGKPPDEALPKGVEYSPGLCRDADIYHFRSDSECARDVGWGPWVATCHTDPAVWGLSRHQARRNWIFVSQSLARSMNFQRFVYNGIDPMEYVYSEKKQSYLLFVATLRLAWKKGLAEAIAIAQLSGRRLYVAGSDPDKHLVAEVRREVEKNNMLYLGEISGAEKADIFAGAAALVFPTQINEAFGLVLAEAMMSGTPVVCSAHGACSELVTSDVGFVCNDRQGYLAAIDKLTGISPAACRARAMNNFHYLVMAKAYINEYLLEISRFQQSDSQEVINARTPV